MGASVNKSDIIDSICQNTNEDKVVVSVAINFLLDHLSKNLAKNHRIEIRKFGSFTLKSFSKKLIKNPGTGNSYPSAKFYKRVLFKPSGLLKHKVNSV